MNILIYPLRRDLRLQDNPILHEIAKCKHEFTHVLPVYIFPAQQVEVSGFIPKDPEGHTLQSPYPEARSANAGFWRCGVHRAKFLAESVWDLRHDLEKAGSGLEIRVGMVGEVVSKMLRGFAAADGEKDEVKVGGVWMTGDVGPEELIEQREVKEACEEAGVDFRLFVDEKYFIHEYVLPQYSELSNGSWP
jgi:deoxyribodipyrimidine photo-lyase